MTDRPSRLLKGLGLDLARRIDADCRRFEADWRQGRHPRIENYLVEVPDEGRPALKAELKDLEREAAQVEVGGRVRPSGSDSEAPTIAEFTHRTDPLPSLDDEAKVNTGRQCREARLAPSVRRHRSSFCEAPAVPSLGSSYTPRQNPADGAVH